eukprot:565569-Pleurochrysis_carterae.AAC.1
MRLKVLRRSLKAWQARIPYYHASAISCSASPLLLQLAVAATSGRADNKASYSPSTQPHHEDRGKEASGSRCRHALGSQLNNSHEGTAQRRINSNAKTCKCE